MKKLADQYMKQKGLNMPGLHEHEDSSSSEENKVCRCEYIHDPLNCSAILELRPKWKYRISNAKKDEMTNESQLDLLKSEESQMSLPHMRYSKSTKNIAN